MALTTIDDRGLKTPIDLLDSEKIRFGTGNDSDIFHDGSNMYLTNTAGSIHIQGKAGENSLKATPDGSVELYHDNTKKFETTSSGGTLYGDWTADANFLLADSDQIKVGTGADLRIYHTGSHSYISNRTNNLYIESANYVVIASTDANGSNQEDSAKFLRNGNVELYYDDSKKFETTSGGAVVQGQIGVVGSGVSLSIADSGKAAFGAGDDLQIYHDGTNSRIHNTTGDLVHRTEDQFGWYNAAGSETVATFTVNGSCELYYDNSKKFETTSGGVQVTGAMVIPDGGSASNRISIGNSEDLLIYHSTSDNVIECTNDHPLWLQSDGAIRLTKDAAAEYYATFNPDGAVDLYWNGTKKFETTQYGAKISSNLSAGFLEVITTGSGGDGHIEIKGGEGGGAVLSLISDEGDDNEDKWRIQNAGDNRLGFRSKKSGSWVEKLGITDYGDLHPTGHVYMDSGYGIAFDPYGGSGVNLLDDYEEGSWTPTLPGGGNMGIYNASYTKIGRMVSWWAYIYPQSVPNDSTGFTIGGFPFTSGSTANMAGSAVCGYSGSLATEDFGYYKNTGDTVLSLYLIGGGSVGGTILNSHITGATRYFALSGTYYTN